ncbi:MAG: RNA polymerase sigma factor [bacterium]|nr:RNA polymerase sigma factor [bacterium]
MENPTAINDDSHVAEFWRAAYQRHGADMLAFLRCRAATSEDAEELLQETFVRAIRSGKLRSPESVRSYLFTIAHNLLRNQHRRERISPLVAAADKEATAPQETDRIARVRSLCERLAEVLLQLPDKHRRAFELAVIERIPYTRIAEMTGWSLASVKVNVYRARHQILEQMASDLEARSELGR